jgi:demethylmenaquinone methyltransferase/2-methoxy-6-polyprenyl-1,4-benzoquinol methylase
MEGSLANLTGIARERYVQEMFTRIAHRYDLMNRLMTAGQDVRWRKEVIRLAQLPAQGRLLDLGTGTGDLAREILLRHPEGHVVAADFTLEMMRVGQAQHFEERGQREMNWTTADALRLPFPSASFDAVVSGFLMRNVSDVRLSLQEQYRLLKRGGHIVILDTAPPAESPWLPLIHFHLHTVIPTLGKLISGQAEAYQYLPDSTEAFLHPEQMAMRLVETGFRNVAFQLKMFGTVAIHWGEK